jgi:hypothetical protein
MLYGAVFISFILPLQISTQNPRFEPFLVQAIIDSAIIIGLPPSKLARRKAFLSQMPEPLTKESYQASEVVTVRKLFFRRYF